MHEKRKTPNNFGRKVFHPRTCLTFCHCCNSYKMCGIGVDELLVWFFFLSFGVAANVKWGWHAFLILQTHRCSKYNQHKSNHLESVIENNLATCNHFGTGMGSISVPGQLPTYPSHNPTLTLNCYKLTVVGLGEG